MDFDFAYTGAQKVSSTIIYLLNLADILSTLVWNKMIKSASETVGPSGRFTCAQDSRTRYCPRLDLGLGSDDLHRWLGKRRGKIEVPILGSKKRSEIDFSYLGISRVGVYKCGTWLGLPRWSEANGDKSVENRFSKASNDTFAFGHLDDWRFRKHCGTSQIIESQRNTEGNRCDVTAIYSHTRNLLHGILLLTMLKYQETQSTSEVCVSWWFFAQLTRKMYINHHQSVDQIKILKPPPQKKMTYQYSIQKDHFLSQISTLILRQLTM